MNSHDRIGYDLGLRQEWNMYAPGPKTIHGWIIAPADLADGSQIDAITEAPVSRNKPDDIGAYMGDDHWRRYLSNIFEEPDPKTLQIFADYLISKWNDHHFKAQRVQSISIIFMWQNTNEISNPQEEVLYFSS